VSTNPDSILDSVKKSLGFESEYEAFDVDIILLINSAFGALQQVGVGGSTGFVIDDNTTLWTQYASQLLFLGMVKHYIFLYVKMAFDPPATSFAIEAVQKQMLMLEWRINIAVESLTPPSDPSTPADDDDDDVQITYFTVKTITLTFGPTISMDASEANTFYLTMTDDCTIQAPVFGSDGGRLTLEIISNGHSVTWGAGWNFGEPGEPALSSGGKTDIISAVFRESTADWYAGFTPGF
jgi:hypothetical protein